MISPPADYQAEASIIRELVIEHAGNPDQPICLLELGAGGGHTLSHLPTDWHLTAIDLSSDMLDQCRKLVPHATCVVGDMRNPNIDAPFDVILIHDAVDYLITEADIAATLASCRRLLADDGLLLLAPTYTRETFNPGDLEADQRVADGVRVTYFTYVRDVPGNEHALDMLMTICIDKGKKNTQMVTDVHRCGLFATGQWLDMLDKAGFVGRLVSGDELECLAGDAIACDRDDDSIDGAAGDWPWVLFHGVVKR